MRIIALFFSLSTASYASSDPAADLCARNGGAFLAATDSQNRSAGLCSFGKAAIEEWTLWCHFHGCVAPLAVASYLREPLRELPLENFCETRGATQEALQLGAHGVAEICSFADGSQIEKATLYYGAESPRNATLTRVLKQVK